MLGVMNYIAFG